MHNTATSWLEWYGFRAGMIWWTAVLTPDRDRPGGYDRYSEALGHFIRDVRRDLSAPDLPFVIGVIGVGGPVEHYGASTKTLCRDSSVFSIRHGGSSHLARV
ncbi:MAG: hypothetical protein ACJ0BN_00395 [Limisphaerales bacterium]